MKTILYLAISFIGFFNCDLNAQPAEIRGQLTDHNTGEAVLFAQVMLYQDSVIVNGAYSNDDGYFSIRPIDPGKYVLMTYDLGYESYTDSTFVVNADETITLNLTLKEEAVKLTYPEVRIECKKVKVKDIEKK